MCVEGVAGLERGVAGLERGVVGQEKGVAGLERGVTEQEMGVAGLERGVAGQELSDGPDVHATSRRCSFVRLLPCAVSVGGAYHGGHSVVQRGTSQVGSAQRAVCSCPEGGGFTVQG